MGSRYRIDGPERRADLRRLWFIAMAATGASALLISCGETAVRVKGRLIDATGAPRENCIVTVTYRGRTVGEFRVSGKFDETAVFRPSTSDPLTVRGSCYGTRASFEREIPAGEKLDAAIDLGNLVLP